MPELLRAGPGSILGLRWLARVGPSPMDAWACAMGWGLRAAQSHSQRLEREGWLRRYAMTRGNGSLLVATDRGIRVGDLELSAAPRPTPTWWAHDCACAWTAAWLTVRRADWRGPREVLADPRLVGKLEWQTGAGWRRATHRPDLVLSIPNGGVVVEVELRRKSSRRLAAVLSLYRSWLADSKIAGVVYVCGSTALADRVARFSTDAGIPDRAARFELLDDVQAQALRVKE
ncbi:MAG: hypothetical protein ACYC91_07035 [Solirubrobacteraceae bacterium]